MKNSNNETKSNIQFDGESFYKALQEDTKKLKNDFIKHLVNTLLSGTPLINTWITTYISFSAVEIKKYSTEIKHNDESTSFEIPKNIIIEMQKTLEQF